jgi:hypothetical protein
MAVPRRIWPGIAMCMLACSGSKRSPPVRSDAPVADAGTFQLADQSWMRSHDFDGDGKRDLVDVELSGGAHCCYRLTVALSSGPVVALPFELDGGYVGGLSLDRPENFTVAVDADGVARLVMTIATYAGRFEPIPLVWVRLGARSHRIAVSLRGGTMKIDNLGWGCGDALDALTHRRLVVWEGWPSDCDVGELKLALDGTSTSDNDVLLGTAKTEAALDHVSMLGSDGRHFSLHIARRDIRVLRVDLEQPLGEARSITDALGPPEARMPYTRWGFTHPTGQWVWASRGLVVYVDRENRTIRRAGVFVATDRSTYERDLRWSGDG